MVLVHMKENLETNTDGVKTCTSEAVVAESTGTTRVKQYHHRGVLVEFSVLPSSHSC